MYCRLADGPVGNFVAALEEESKVAAKIIYKNRNQHRGSQHFRHFAEVVRVLGRVDFAAVNACALEAKEVLAAKRPLPMSITANAKQHCDAMASLVELCVKKSKSIHSLLAHGFFMPLALGMLSIVARIAALCDGIRRRLLPLPSP